MIVTYKGRKNFFLIVFFFQKNFLKKLNSLKRGVEENNFLF